MNVLGTRDLVVLAIFRAAPAAMLLLPIATLSVRGLGITNASGPVDRRVDRGHACRRGGRGVVSEFMHYQRHASWEHFANAATPAPVAFPSLFRLLGGGRPSP